MEHERDLDIVVLRRLQITLKDIFLTSFFNNRSKWVHVFHLFYSLRFCPSQLVAMLLGLSMLKEISTAMDKGGLSILMLSGWKTQWFLEQSHSLNISSFLFWVHWATLIQPVLIISSEQWESRWKRAVYIQALTHVILREGICSNLARFKHALVRLYITARPANKTRIAR